MPIRQLRDVMKEAVTAGDLHDITREAYWCVLVNHPNEIAAAAVLGVTRQTIRNRIREYGWDIQEFRELKRRQHEMKFR